MFNKIIELINAIKKPKHKLTNQNINTDYRNIEFWVFKKDLTSAFVYWVLRQSPYNTPDIMPALIAYDNYLTPLFHNDDIPIKFNYESLKPILSEYLFASIPEILELNGELDEFGKDSFMKAAHAILRVPYLTKEQIEAEGWELIQIYPKGSCVFQKETKEDGYELTYDFTEYILKSVSLEYIFNDVESKHIVPTYVLDGEAEIKDSYKEKHWSKVRIFICAIDPSYLYTREDILEKESKEEEGAPFVR